jgi:hypothetical protein
MGSGSLTALKDSLGLEGNRGLRFFDPIQHYFCVGYQDKMKSLAYLLGNSDFMGHGNSLK